MICTNRNNIIKIINFIYIIYIKVFFEEKRFFFNLLLIQAFTNFSLISFYTPLFVNLDVLPYRADVWLPDQVDVPHPLYFFFNIYFRCLKKKLSTIWGHLERKEC